MLITQKQGESQKPCMGCIRINSVLDTDHLFLILENENPED